MTPRSQLPVELLLPGRVVRKRGAVESLFAEASVFGARGLAVIGTAVAKRDAQFGTLEKQGVSVYRHKGAEPTIVEVAGLIEFAKAQKADWIAGIGGGSVMDLAKAAAGLYNAPHPPEYYQAGGKLEQRGIPFIAVPTTAGSGAEATPNAVLTDKAKKLKLSIRDKRWMAGLVILDAGLMAGAPLLVIRDSGLDALVQAYESYISKNASLFTESLSLNALKLLVNHLPLACLEDGDAHHESLLEAAFLAGVALCNARLGVIHGLAHPLGVLYGLPHGAVCAAALLPSIRYNRDAMGDKYRVLSEITGGDFESRAAGLLRTLNFKSPFAGLTILEPDGIVAETLKSGSTAANPKPVSRVDAEDLLTELFN